MASSVLVSKMQLQSIRIPIHQSINCRQIEVSFIFFTQQVHPLQLTSLSQFRYKAFRAFRALRARAHCSVSSPAPPNSKEEAILQAKVSLSSTLEKGSPLKNNLKFSGKLKKSKQPRLRVEIPVVDESTFTLTQLAVDVFVKMPVRKILLFWPDDKLRKAATKAFESQSDNAVENVDFDSISSQDTRVLTCVDLAVFMAPTASELEVMKLIADTMYPKPVVIFNPKWSFEEEIEFGELSGFVASFEVVYSFMGLEVRGILSKRKGIIFKFVRDGILRGEKWNVFVEENGDLKLVSSFKARPSIVEVENVLYNLMAINSPITKTAKFLKGLVSNATGKK